MLHQSAYLTNEEVAEYLAARVPPSPPTLETIRSWSRPSWRRSHPHYDVPVPAGKIGRRVLWLRANLDAWLARKLGRASETLRQ